MINVIENLDGSFIYRKVYFFGILVYKSRKFLCGK
jgi:hypothetical protein